ncbi:MAG: hypothetical protein RIQ60_1950 [Pseudomonadota bacterium]|jgi:FtsP/CotA-like multicopper oxidase with cupredoxin domain
MFKVKKNLPKVFAGDIAKRISTQSAIAALRPLLTVSGLSLGAAAALAGPGEVTLPSGIKSPTYYANSPSGVWASGSNSGTALRKFVDSLPGVGPAGANNFGAYIPVAVAEKWVTPNGLTTNDDYYELAIVEYTARAHSDLKGESLLRGYVQIASEAWLKANPNKGVPLFYPGTRNADGTLAPGAAIMITRNGAQVQAVAVEAPRPLGPIISAESGVAVRLLVRNLLPEARAALDAAGKVVARNGDLFLPVDQTIIGSGVAADGVTYYTQNRASVHLHGGDSPWISDGTPYQWFAPAGVAGVISTEQAAMAAAAAAAGQAVPAFTPVSEFLRGASAVNVPDMPDPGPGAMTFYYPNKQSARMLWYHDHTVGLTRVNVYAGMAAGYLIGDATERSLVSSGVLPSAANTIPLIFQDKTFVPQDIALQDRNWNTAAWGLEGDFWFPHVYESAGTTNLVHNGFSAAAAEINTDPTLAGANPTGRWDYGPELLGTPPASPLMTGEYGRPEVAADGLIHSPSTTPEAFMDTPLVNGVAYPTLSVQPQAYRFRILNATNDRFMNLGLYVAQDDATSPVRDSEVSLVPVPAAGLAACNTVDAASGLAATNADGTPCWPAGWPTQANVILPNVPDPATAGPKIVQVGNETGWLQQTRHIVSTPASYAQALTPGGGTTTLDPLNFLNNVGTHGLFLGNAERAEVVIDFAAYAGKTLILYNDSPAPAPGFDDRYDYYTGSADLSGAGGAESTKPGYGPNTRTIMQIKVAPLPAGQTATAFDYAATDAAIKAAFIARNEPLPVVTADAVAALLNNRAATSLPAEVVGANQSVSIQSVGIVDKAILEEWDPNFGRLNAVFGIVTQAGPRSQAYADRPTEIMRDGETTLWRIAHTGVDTHPVHFHLVNLQIVARVNADNTVEPPSESELGWKDTVKMNPAQDVIVAFRPKKPELGGFTVPASIRKLDPTQVVGVPNGFTQMDPVTGQPAVVTNAVADLGWEYTWHCHILGHEENDFMRVVSFIPKEVPPVAPGLTGSASQGAIDLTFTDNADNEYAYLVERAPVTNGVTGAFVTVDKLLAQTGVGSVSNWTDATAVPGQAYAYRVSAMGSQTVGDVINPVTTPSSEVRLQLAAAGVSLAPVVGAVTSATASLTFAAAKNATGYVVEQSADGGLTWTAATAALTLAPAPAPVSASVSGLLPGNNYQFRVVAVSGAVQTAPSPISAVHTPAVLVAPVMAAANSVVTDTKTGATNVTLNWTSTSAGQTGWKVERFTGTLANSALANAPWSVLSSAVAPTALSYNDNTAATNTAYVYRVSAFETVNGVTTAGAATTQAVTSAKVVAAPTLSKAATAGATVTLSFTDNSTNETSFSIERAPVVGGLIGAFAAVGSVARTGTASTGTGGAVTFADATALAGNVYAYQVKAISSTGVAPNVITSTSLPSNVLEVAVDLAAPTTLTAAAGVATATATPVTLSFTDVSVGETGFEVYRSVDGGVTWPALPLATVASATQATINTATKFTDTTAVPGVNYAYKVRAVQTAVAPAVPPVSAFSLPVAVTLNLGQPTNLSVALGTATATTQPIVLAWVDNASNETRYAIERAAVTVDPTSGLPVAGTFAPLAASVARTGTAMTGVAGAVAFTDATALLNTAYAYRVVAQRVVGAGATAVTYSSLPSDVVFTSAAAVRTAPSTLSASTLTGTGVALSWIDNSSNETSFQVMRTTTGTAFPATPLGTAKSVAGTGKAVTFTDKTAAVGTAYDYQIVAVTPTGNLASGVVTAQIPLAAPVGVTASPVATGLQVGWTDVSNNETGFEVVRTAVDPLTLAPLTGAVSTVTLVACTAAQGTAMNAARTWIDTTAVAGTTYAYVVRAVRTVAAVTARSADSTPVVYASRNVDAPGTPNAVISTASRVTVSWADLSTSESGFIVERAITPVGGVAGAWTKLATVARTAAQGTSVNTTVSYTDNLVAPVVQGTYQYRVTAVNQTGVGAAAVTNASSLAVMSNALSFVAPAAPTGVTAAAVPGTPGSVLVDWADPATNESGFSVQYSTLPFTPGAAAAPVGTVTVAIAGANPGATANAVLSGLVSGTTYYVRIAATNLVGQSAWVDAAAAVVAP